MVKKSNINWTAKQLSKMVNNETIKFDHAIQRDLVWDDYRKSLLIHSLADGFPVPPFYAVKVGSVYSILDGKQRASTITAFLNDEFELSDLPDVELEDGSTVDISGMKFSELPEDIQDEISGYSLTIYHYPEEITNEQLNDLFFRLNNGKGLTSIELTRVKAKSIDTIKRIGSHELFKIALTDKAIRKYTNEDIIIKSYALLYSDSPSLETKSIRPLMESADITEVQESVLNKAFDRIKEAYEIISKSEDKQELKAAKRLLTRTHLVSIVPIALKSIEDEMEIEDFADFIIKFFDGARSATSIEEYNNNATSGSAKSEAVKTRLRVINDFYTKNYPSLVKALQELKNVTDELIKEENTEEKAEEVETRTEAETA